MAYCATPILYLNMGGEMMYVLQQRLQTQRVSSDKTIQVINDVMQALLDPKQLEVIFERGPLMSLTWLRSSLERVVLSSIMKLDDNSMNKLFDLMIMMVKYQLAMATGPREVILSTLNHLDALRDMTADQMLRTNVDLAHRLLIEAYGDMSYKDIWQVRTDCLREIQQHCVRVSVLLRLGMQNEDTSFNRVIQRYDEKYPERRQVLENVKLLEYSDDENEIGSLSFYGNRVTLLGKNVYSPSFGLMPSKSNRSGGQSLQQLLATSNKSVRREIETLATQLGNYEEPTPPSNRPFSLRLFGHNESVMDCKSELRDRLDTESMRAQDEAEGNVVDDVTCSNSVDQYRTNLIRNINTDFDADVEQQNKNQQIDVMKILDAV